uniref:Uncharacterized protein n=1 Tax=Zooxanthella nutricula TaxID=1333877 RepID=A0A7S2LYW7_9DINO
MAGVPGTGSGAPASAGAAPSSREQARALQSAKSVCMGGKRRRWLVKVQAVNALRGPHRAKKAAAESSAQEGLAEPGAGEGSGDAVGTAAEAEWNAQIRRMQALQLQAEREDGAARPSFAEGGDIETGEIKPSLIGKSVAERESVHL